MGFIGTVENCRNIYLDVPMWCVASPGCVTQVEMEDSMEPSTEENQEVKNQKKKEENEGEEEEEESQTERETFLKVRDTGDSGDGTKPSSDVST